MIANKLIDDIQSFKPKTIRDSLILRDNLDLLKKSIKFDLGDDQPLFDLGTNKNGKNCFELKHEDLKLLPFNTCLFQLRDTITPIYPYFTLLHRIDSSSYKLTPYDAFEYTGGKYAPVVMSFILSFSDGGDSVTTEILDAHEMVKSKEDMAKLLGFYIQPVTHALRMMACSNVESVDNTPSKLKKNRVKKGKTPLFTYKTLHITDTRNIKNKNESGGVHSSPRAHLRRGHIRNISEKKRVWVQPCVVGDKSKGIVKKDYQFTPSQAD
jgi:hypothetical protein